MAREPIVESQPGAPIWVHADPTQVWRYGKVMSVVGAVLMPAIVGVALLADAVHGATEALTVAILGWALLGACSFGICLMWRTRSARISYCVDADGLKVFRGETLLSSIARERIDSFQMVGHMDLKQCFFAPGPPPSWPRGLVALSTATDPNALIPNTMLPEIMIWGRLEARKAEWEIEKALRATGRLKY